MIPLISLSTQSTDLVNGILKIFRIFHRNDLRTKAMFTQGLATKLFEICKNQAYSYTALKFIEQILKTNNNCKSENVN